MRETRRGRKLTEKKVRLAGLIVLLIFFGMFGGGYVYAKYYSQSVQNGIAIASGVYFTSNYAVASTDKEDFFESIVKTGYQGTDTDFVFEVRNYENNMLFNESSVEIPYSLYFWLGETPVDATYTVEYGGESKTLYVGETNKVGFSMHTIEGGRAVANKYTVKVDVGESKHTSVPIYVEVATEAGSVVNAVLRGKMIFSTASMAESYIESQMFVVSANVSADEEKFAEIQKLSELTYEIKTVGEIATGDNATEELMLSWDPTVLEINMFDDAFMEWKRATGNSAPLEAANGWNYITLWIMPYSSETVGFFRGSEFDIKATDMDTLQAAIWAEKYSADDEDTD